MERRPSGTHTGQVLRVGRRLVLCPAGRCDAVDSGIPLYLGRTRAFGSGLHETTISCLEEIDAASPLKGPMVLDVGCGTGILSIAALLLGAARAIAFDIDPEAAGACLSNARLNGVQDRVNVYCGTLDALDTGTRFDLICANIYGDIILDLAEDLACRLTQDGTLILSGIDLAYLSDIKGTFKGMGLDLARTRIMEEYVTMIWGKKVQDPKSKIQG